MMTSDLQILARFLYGSSIDERLAADAGIQAANVRRMISGRRDVPPAVAEFLLRRAADRWLLRGWADQRPPPGLSADTAAELDARISAARSWDNPERTP